MLPWRSGSHLASNHQIAHNQSIQPVAHNDFINSCDHNSLKFISYNIQVGIQTQAYHHYLTRSWQHFLPHRGRETNLVRVADVVRDFDIVALQEVDGGSIRSGFVNQIRFLSEQADLKYWYQQRNRNLGVVAQHSNGLISRFTPNKVESHKLPGFIPGRGAIFVEWGEGPDAIMVVMMHLALGKGGQNKQLGYIREVIGDHHNVVLMGDMNTHAEQLLTNSPLQDLNLHEVDEGLHTFPSWQPDRGLDHILVSDSLNVKQVSVIQSSVSDHLPIAMEIEPPEGISLDEH